MDNCQNCYEHIRYGCGGKGSWARDHKNVCWKPDYPTLEFQKKTLESSLEVVGKLCQNADQALERACETFVSFIAENEDCTICPIYKGKKCTLYDETDGCKNALIRHFREVAQ